MSARDRVFGLLRDEPTIGGVVSDFWDSSLWLKSTTSVEHNFGEEDLDLSDESSKEKCRRSPRTRGSSGVDIEPVYTDGPKLGSVGKLVMLFPSDGGY